MSRLDMFLKKILLPKQNEKDGKTVKEQVMMSQGNQHYLPSLTNTDDTL